MLKLLTFLLLFGCSGYRFSQQDNPLSLYGIQTLAVPMFYNYSNLSELHTDFTRETYRILTGFSGLKLINGYSSEADALLIGIIKTPEKLMESVRASNLRLAQLKAKNAIGPKRENFYIPGTSDVQLYLQIIVIKRPTEEELTLLRSGLSDKIRGNSKIIFNEYLPLRMIYTREVLDDAGVQVVGTQNSGVQRKVLKNLAVDAAVNVRDMILDAF